MSTSIAQLHADLTLQYAQFTQGLKNATAASNQASKQISTAFNAVKGAAIGMGAAIAGISFVNLAKGGLDYASSLGETAQQLGITTKSLQEYRYAASQTGVSQESMDKSLAKLSKNVGLALTGNKDMAGSFKKLGIDITDASGHARDSGDILRDLAGKIQAIHDPAQEAAVVTKLLGKSGQELLPMLESGASGVDGLRKAAEDLGIVLDDKLIGQADAAADKLSEMKMVLEANIARTVAENATSILNLANSVSNLAVGLAKFWSQNPAKAMAIMGALSGAAMGARVGGIWGAAAGGLIGGAAGYRYGNAGSESDLANRYAASNRALEPYTRNPAMRHGDYYKQLLVDRGQLLREMRAAEAARKGTRGGAGLGGGGLGGGGGDFDVSDFSASGGSKSKKAKESPYAKEIENLKLANEQLQRNEKDQELYNALKSAGVSIDSAQGKEIEKLVRAHQELEQARDANKLIEELRFEDEQLKRTDREQAIYNALHRIGLDVTSDLGKAVAAAAAAHYDAAKAAKEHADELQRFQADYQKKQEDLIEANKEFGRSLADIGIRGFDDLIHGAKSFGDAMSGILMDLGDLFLEELVYKPLREWAANQMGGGGGGFFGSILNFGMSLFGGGTNALGGTLGGAGAFAGLSSNITAAPLATSVGVGGGAFPTFSLPGRASGGPVNAGDSYMVGEKGPEIFRPRTSGTIIPNHALNGGSGGMTINSTVFGVNDPHMVRRLSRESIVQAMPVQTRMSVDATFARSKRPQLG